MIDYVIYEHEGKGNNFLQLGRELQREFKLCTKEN